MPGLARVTDLEVIGARALRVVFTDGLVRELDFSGTLEGILASLDDDSVFGEATVDRTAGTVSWPGGIDLDPDVLHGDSPAASGAAPQVIREYRLQQTS